MKRWIIPGLLGTHRGIALQNPHVTEVTPGRRGLQNLTQGRSILKTQVDAMTRQRMYAMCRVTDQGQPRCHNGSGPQLAERETLSGRQDTQSPQHMLPGLGHPSCQRLMAQTQQLSRMRLGGCNQQI